MPFTPTSIQQGLPSAAAGRTGAAGGWSAAVAVAGFAAVAGLSALAWQGATADGGSNWHIGLLGLAVSLPALWLGLLLRRQQGNLRAQARRIAEQDARLQALARKAELLQRAEQVAETGSFDWNPVTGALHWSDGHFRLWGHAPGALTPDAAAFRARIHPDDLGALEARLQHSLKVVGRHEFTHRLRWPDGTVLDVLACGDVTHDAHGRAVRMVGTVQDITRRRAAEARLQLHEFLVNTITDPVSVVDEAGTCLLVNQAWSQRTGLPAEQVVGRAPAALQQQLGNPARDTALQRCLAGELPDVVLAELDLPATGRRWWETTSRDVTARQAAAQALEASRALAGMPQGGQPVLALVDGLPDQAHFDEHRPAVEDREPVGDPAGGEAGVAAHATASAPAAASAASGMRQVLYIDDNPVNTMLMAAMFERLPGLALQCECDPKAGVALALAAPPALLLIDIQMPGIDGFEVLRRLRANPATQAVPALAVSANAMPQDLACGRAAGFADYLTKPLEMPRLQAALQAVLPGWQATPG